MDGGEQPTAGPIRGPAEFSSTFTRDKLGRIVAKSESIGGVATQWAYRYDLAGRLESVRRNGNEVARYGYDTNSNRTTAVYGAPTSGQLNYCAPTPIGGQVSLTGAVDTQDRLLSYGSCVYSYGRNGELSTKVDSATGQATTYVYDAFGNLRTFDLPDGRAIEYVIDGVNRRVGKKIDGVLVQGFLYLNQLEPIAELDGNGNVVATFVYADRPHVPVYMLKGGAVYRIVSDHLGSVRLVIDVSTGAIAQRIDYDAFGAVLQDTNPGFQPFGFAGGMADQDIGLAR